MALTSPRYDLESCIHVARCVFEDGGELSSHTLAEKLGYKSIENGAFLSRVGAAKQFGLIEGSSASLRSTDRAAAILRPDYPETEAKARFDAFLSVTLFNAFFETMEGRPLPDGKLGLKNMMMHRFGLKEGQAAIAAARMMDSAEQAGLFSIAGRSKMLRPSFASVPTVDVPEPNDEGLRRVAAPAAAAAIGVGLHKLIEGALDELPKPGDKWDEDGLRAWLALIELALRVVYKVPEKAPPKSEGPATGSKPATPQ